MTINLWSLPDGSLLKTLRGHSGWVDSVAIRPDGRLLVSGSDDGTVKLWSLPDGALLKTLNGHSDQVWSVAISPDGRLLASGSSGRTIMLWSLPDGQPLPTCLMDVNASTTAAKPIQYTCGGGGHYRYPN